VADMSVTVANCLELPSLKDATVAAGADGLNKIVTAVSVLEYADPDILSSDEFLVGNELIVTAFVTAKDDVDKQCGTLRLMHEKGVVAFALYYVGVILPKLDKRLIKVANELSLPLIVKPRGRMDYRYREVITEVMEAIFLDQRNETNLVPAIIERIAQLPERAQTLRNFLRIISDRIHCTVVLTDENQVIIGDARWPISESPYEKYDETIARYNESVGKNTKTGSIDTEIDGIHYTVFHNVIKGSEKQKYGLFIIKGDEAFDDSFNDYYLQQISDAIYIFINLHANKAQSSGSLIKAILDGNFHDINAIIRHLNVARENIQTMWILIDSEAQEGIPDVVMTDRIVKAKTMLSEEYKYSITEPFENSIVMFIDVSLPSAPAGPNPSHFIDSLCVGDEKAYLICFSGLIDWYDFREAYNDAQEYWYALTKIYPGKRTFSMNELVFAKSCQEIIQRGANVVDQYLKRITPLLQTGNSDGLIDTLLVYLLDAESNVRETAKLLSFHENSIKYRLKQIKQQLQYDVNKMPDAYELYLSAALYRLYNQ
jgi:hypothetical protein